MQNKKPQIVFIRGKRTTLRPIMEADIPLLMKWVNDPDVRTFIMNTFPAMEAREHQWLKSLNEKRETEIVLVIEVRGKPIGTMGLHGINWKDRVATTGAVIGEKSYWGKGYGTDAKMALLKYAFDTLGLRKIISRVKAFNKRSLAYSLHCGYRIEGRLKKHHFDDGRYWDEIILGLFRHEWLPCYETYMGRRTK